MLFEFLLGLAQNVSNFLYYIAVVFALICIICVIAWFGINDGTGDEKEREKANKLCGRIFRFAFPMFLVLFLIGNLPKVDDLWKIRISLIKFHLASPENLEAGVKEIERIGHKLECHYIGCEEDKKKPAEEKKEEESK